MWYGRMPRSIKILAALFGTVLLGSFGSGLWELLLRQRVLWLGDKLLILVSAVFTGYLDVIYGGVSPHYLESLAIWPYLLIWMGFTFGPWFLIWRGTRSLRGMEHLLESPASSLDSKPPTLLELHKYRRVFIRIGIPLALLTSLFYSGMLLTDAYTIRAGSFLERSIEIVAPHVDDTQRLQLRADFRAIETAADFYRLEDRLRSIAKQAAIKLPDFNSIR